MLFEDRAIERRGETAKLSAEERDMIDLFSQKVAKAIIDRHHVHKHFFNTFEKEFRRACADDNTDEGMLLVLMVYMSALGACLGKTIGEFSGKDALIERALLKMFDDLIYVRSGMAREGVGKEGAGPSPTRKQ